MARIQSSLYPRTHPSGSRVLASRMGDVTLADRLFVYCTSLLIVGSVMWMPLAYAWAWRRFKCIPKDQTKRRAMCATIILASTALLAVGPHRNRAVGRFFQVRKWQIWKAWLRFLAVEVVADHAAVVSELEKLRDHPAIIAIAPHGIFPFGLALPAITHLGETIFGAFRPVVASATGMYPFVRDLLSWLHAVDASRSAVDSALADGSRIGVAPGGIAEMFEGYPKHLTHPDNEYTIVGKGIFRMAIKHAVPIVPVYVFGSTKLLKRLALPSVIETISLALRVSLVVFFGQKGLPIPFQQRLLYVVGDPVVPPNHPSDDSLDGLVEDMQSRFCEELVRVFDRHKESYGWGHKRLLRLSR